MRRRGKKRMMMSARKVRQPVLAGRFDSAAPGVRTSSRMENEPPAGRAESHQSPRGAHRLRLRLRAHPAGDRQRAAAQLRRAGAGDQNHPRLRGQREPADDVLARPRAVEPPLPPRRRQIGDADLPAHLHRDGLRLPATADRRGLFHWVTRGYLNANLSSFQLSDDQADVPGLRLRLRSHVRGPGPALPPRPGPSRGIGPRSARPFRRPRPRQNLPAARRLRRALDPALLPPGKTWPPAGWAYMPLSFVMPWWGKKKRKRRQRLAAELAGRSAVNETRQVVSDA